MKKIVSLKKIVLFTAFGMTAFMGGYGEDVKTPSPHMEKGST